MIHKLGCDEYTQIYINAHGAAPVSRKSITRDGHNYRKDNLKKYFARVPNNTILVTCTPPNNYFMVDKKEKVVKEIINNLILEKLNYLTCLDQIDNESSYVFDFLREIQIYEPGDEYYNQEIVFENTKINNIFKLDRDKYTILNPGTRLYYGKDCNYKIESDVRTNSKIDPILDKSKKYLHPWDCNFIPYSLAGLIDSIRDNQRDELLVIYAFMCNPCGNPQSTSLNLNNRVNDIYQNGLEKCQKYRDNYYYKHKIRRKKREKIKQFLETSLPTGGHRTPFLEDKIDINHIENTDWCLQKRLINNDVIKNKLKLERKKRNAKFNRVRNKFKKTD